MAKIRNKSGSDLFVPALGRMVMDGQVVEVPDADVYGFTQQSIWQAADKAAEAADLEAEADYQARLAVAQGATTDPEPVAPDATDTPVEG